MGINLAELCRELNLDKRLDSLSKIEIIRAQPLPKGLHEHDESILYVGTTEEILSRTQTSKINFLCVDFLSEAGKKESASSVAYSPYNAIPSRESTLLVHNIINCNLLWPKTDMDTNTAIAVVDEVIDNADFLQRGVFELFQAVGHSKGVQHIVDVAYSLLGNPLVVSDNSFRVLAITPLTRPPDDLWVKLTKDGFYPNEYVNTLVRRDLYNRIYDDSPPVLIENDSTECKYVSKKIVVSDNATGFVSLLEYAKPLTKRELALFPHLCKALSLGLQSDRLLKDANDDKYIYVWNQLLSEAMDKSLAIDRLRYAGVKTKKYLMVALFQYSTENPPFSPEHLLTVLKKILPGQNGIVFKQQIAFIMMSDAREDLDFQKNNELKESLAQYNLLLGLSYIYEQIEDTYHYYKQAAFALRAGKKIAQDSVVFPYATYCCYHLLELAQGNVNLERLIDPRFRAMLDYDRKHNTVNAETLKVYLDNGMKIGAAAREMKVHRNTIDYRVNKFCELFNINLDDGNTIFSLELTLRILRYLQYL